MLTRMFLAILATATISGCLMEHRAPRRVQPAYVAQCPAGYRYDGHDCRREAPPPSSIVVEVR